MRLLVAEEFAPGRFRRLAVLRASSGSLPMPEAHQGQVVGYVARSAWRQFVAEPAAKTVNFEFPGGRNYRVDRIIGR